MADDKKVAVVTGAGHPQGIGYATAQRLAGEGMRVWALDTQFAEVDNSQVRSCVCDVTDSKAVGEVVDEIAQNSGGIQVLVNNAGVARGGNSFTQLTAEDWQASIDVNLMGVVNVCGAAVPHMDRGGRIVNVASLAGLGAQSGIPACYTATKFAVVGLTKQLALELAPQGIHCNAVCPGSIKTQMHSKAMQLLAEAHNVDLAAAQALENAAIPAGFSAEPAAVADVIAYLISPAADYLTGVALPVAGGMAPGI